MVLEPDQVDPLHHLAQLQVDHHQDLVLARPHRLPGPLLLLPARIFRQEDHGSLGVDQIDAKFTQLRNLNQNIVRKVESIETYAKRPGGIILAPEFFTYHYFYDIDLNQSGQN